MPRPPAPTLSVSGLEVDGFSVGHMDKLGVFFGVKVPEIVDDDDVSDHPDVMTNEDLDVNAGSLETINYTETSVKDEVESSDRPEIGRPELRSRPGDLGSMTARELRELCKEKGLKVRGTKREILRRLSNVSIESPDRAGTEQSFSEGNESEDGSFNAEPELETSSSSSGGSVVALSAEALEKFQGHVIKGDRSVRAPVHYTPSNSVVDDDDSDGQGISVDSDLDVCELSSDSSRARSIVHAIKKRRRL